MSEWSLETLKNLITVKHGYAFKGEYFKESPPGDILLTPGNFAIGGGFQFSKIKYYTGPRVAAYELKPNDLLVTMTDLSKAGDTLGFPALVPDDGRTYLHNQRLGLVEYLSDKVDPLFFYWLMKTREYRHEVLASHSGAVIKHTSPSRILAFEFYLPPENERQNIQKCLQSLEDKIELNRQMNEVLEGMARAVFRDWFVDFGPTRRKMAGEGDPVKTLGGAIGDHSQAKNTAALFPDRLGENGLPEGWEETNVSSITSLLKRGLTPKYTEDGCLIVNQRCIRNGTISFSVARRHDETTRQLKNKQLQIGDVLVNSTGVGTLGRVATVRQLPSRASADTHVTIVRPNPKIVEPVIVALLLEGMADQIANMGHGSTGQTELKPSIIGEIITVLPPRDIQLSFSELVSPLRAKVDSNLLENQTLAEMRDLLLPKLMSGEIRLREGG